jgi:hypothetical protein
VWINTKSYAPTSVTFLDNFFNRLETAIEFSHSNGTYRDNVLLNAPRGVIRGTNAGSNLATG